MTPQHLYDYARDQTGYGEPGYDNALGIGADPPQPTS